MDVIGLDDLPRETKASATKLTNGNATLSEDNAPATATTGGAGRKKAKRKNKAKNSHREDAETELKLEAPTMGATKKEIFSTVTVTSPNVAGTFDGAGSGERANGEVVNSNSSGSGSSSSHKSSHSNGLQTNDALARSVDVISKKLERCVHLGRNGLTNGLPKYGNKLDDGSSPGEEERKQDGATSGKQSTGKTVKKKHRSRQAKKVQATNTSCTVNGGGQGDDEEEEDEEKGDDNLCSNRRASIVVPDEGNQNNQIVTSPSGSIHLKKTEGEEKLTVNKSYSLPEDDPNSAVSPSLTSASTSSISLPVSTQNAEETVESNISPENRPSPIEIKYQVYESERQMPAIMSLIQKDLSEPYSIYTYRYFIHNWPKLCFLALHEDTCVGAIVCKLDIHRQDTRRGYIAMLAVDKDYRKLKIGTTLVQKAIQVMLEDRADEVVLETEITNQPALRLYENLGFVRDKRLFHYYLNGVDALRLKLWFR